MNRCSEFDHFVSVKLCVSVVHFFQKLSSIYMRDSRNRPFIFAVFEA